MEWIIRLLGGFTKVDLWEAHGVGYRRGVCHDLDADMVDLPSWYYDKFGKTIGASKRQIPLTTGGGE